MALLAILANTSTIRKKRVPRSFEPSKILQTPEEIPTGIESNRNSFKLEVKDSTKRNTFSRLGPSNLHGFQYEVYFPPHRKLNMKSSTDDENIKASGTSEVKSILPPVEELLRNMEIRPSHEHQDIKESDTPELVGYFYDPPVVTPTEAATCNHNGIEHDTPEEEGYVYEPPTIKDPELDADGDTALQKAVEYSKAEPVAGQVAQINDGYIQSASNRRDIIRAQENGQKVDPDSPNYSSVKFRSSFFGENGLPRISTDEESDKVSYHVFCNNFYL